MAQTVACISAKDFFKFENIPCLNVFVVNN